MSNEMVLLSVAGPKAIVDDLLVAVTQSDCTVAVVPVRDPDHMDHWKSVAAQSAVAHYRRHRVLSLVPFAVGMPANAGMVYSYDAGTREILRVGWVRPGAKGVAPVRYAGNREIITVPVTAGSGSPDELLMLRSWAQQHGVHEFDQSGRPSS